MTICGPAFDLSFVLCLFSPLLVPLGFAAVAVAGELLVRAFTRA